MASRQIGRVGGVGKSAESINRQVGKLAEERVNEIQKTKWTESASAESAEAGDRDKGIGRVGICKSAEAGDREKEREKVVIGRIGTGR